MHKIYSNSDNHHVKATIVYADEDKKLYFDPEFTKPVLHEKGELRELFHNGMIIVDGDKEYRPTEFLSADGKVIYNSITFAAPDVEM